MIIPVVKHECTYASLDGHTRLYLADSLGFKQVYAYLSEAFYGFDYFLGEARNRNIHTIKDLVLLEHEDYMVQWDKFCEAYYTTRE